MWCYLCVGTKAVIIDKAHPPPDSNSVSVALAVAPLGCIGVKNQETNFVCTQRLIDCGDCCRVKGTALDSSHQLRYTLPGKVPFQVAENIARTKPLVFDAAAWFDSNQLFPRS